ncbi:MAG: ABC transporter substrate-binding protein [Pseudomonadota bacterium]
MSKLPITIATGDYDRVQGLINGRVNVTGCDVNYLTVGPEQLFFRAFRNQEFDVCEISMSSYLMSVARGTPHYFAIPVFISRVFRHSCIYIRTDRGIKTPQDLKGLRVGVPEYQVTAALWARGLLDDEYGVAPSDMRWFCGGLHEPGRTEKVPLALPEEIRIEQISADATLDQMFRDGEIDVLISPRAPNSFLDKHENIDRLFPDYHTEERNYYKKTGIFPIMHVVAIRRSLVQQYPWLASSLYEAFSASRSLAMEHIQDVAALSVTLPWLGSYIDETIQMMGDNYWPYGVQDNVVVLNKLLDYAFRHGTITRKLTLEEIFVPSTLERFKV